MNISNAIEWLVDYGISKQLIKPQDRIYVRNKLMSVMDIQRFKIDENMSIADSLPEILGVLCDAAASRGLCGESRGERELFDTKLMGEITPLPSVVSEKFWSLYESGPISATDWFYEFSQDVNYIRRDAMARDIRWKSQTQYGQLDITINLSKPEKDPRDIAKAKLAPKSGYPACLLCAENEGYAGHANHPARQNLRIVPLTVAGGDWGLQYSPYVYYNEHCILLNRCHIPMAIDRAAFDKLLSFVEQFPHYFVGSNADLPIVGGSILSHDHFQGGHYSFAMERARTERSFGSRHFDGEIGILKWPMSVIRLRHRDTTALAAFAESVLDSWRAYSDENAFIFSQTDGTPHNTITPIARFRDGAYELDLVLRNNITTPEHPLGVFHPHSELHHIKKENIGLIEVMGLAVLPGRLKTEMELLKAAVLEKRSIENDELLSKHSDWLEGWLPKYPNISEENIEGIIRDEIGRVFELVLEHAGVFKRDEAGAAAFGRFMETLA